MNELKRLGPWLEPYTIPLTIATLLVFPVGLFRIVFPLVPKFLIDDVLVKKDLSVLHFMTIALFALVVLQTASNVSQTYLLTSTAERIAAALRSALFGRLARLDLRFYYKHQVGELTSRMTSDVNAIQALVSSQAATVLMDFLMLAGCTAMIFWINARWAAAMLCVVPPLVLTARYFGKNLSKRTTQVQDRLAEAAGMMTETLSEVRVVKSFVRESHEEERFNGIVDQALAAALLRARYRAFFVPLLLMFAFGGLLAMMSVGAKAHVEGKVSNGDLVSFLMYSFLIAATLGSLGNLYAQFREAFGALTRTLDLLEEKPDVPEPTHPQPLAPPRGEIRLEGVSFAYDSTPVLHGIDLVIAPGEMLALVGPSGAGKSTLLNLLPRFFDPTAGRILLDGVDLRALRTDELRRHVGLVPQESVLFSRTIRENLCYGRLDASQAEVEAAARAAHAHDFILAQPEGYETKIGDRGVKLSGGQRQRIAIARMLLKDPHILLLDEATSALDSESEEHVQAAFRELCRGRTTIIIAHRLSTVRSAHRVCVLDEGRIVELGAHQELLERGGLYAHLHALQFRTDRRKPDHPPEDPVPPPPPPPDLGAQDLLM